MSSTTARALTLRALRGAELFILDASTIESCLTATPGLVREPERIEQLESSARATILDGAPIPAALRSSLLPVLGNIAEAIVEVVLQDVGWRPLYDDAAGFASGSGVDLVMLDPAFERAIAIEVKSTIQANRWPRLARGRREQLTSTWLDRASNEGMADLGLTSDDVHVMVVQVHLLRRRWRACIMDDAGLPRAVVDVDDLQDLSWLTAGSTRA